jgi:hypothetical protein
VSEAAAHDSLDELRCAALEGDHGTVRERLRALAEASPEVFLTVGFAVADEEQFLEDLREQYPVEGAPIDRLRALRDAYEPLANELELVRVERIRGVRNPEPWIDPTFLYSQARSLPTLSYEIKSGDLALCEFEHQPSHALALAASIVGGVATLLERNAEAGDEIQEAERRMLGRALDVFSDADEELHVALEEVTVERRSNEEKDADRRTAGGIDDWDSVGRSFH